MVKKVKHAVCPFCGGALIGADAPIKAIDGARYEHHCNCGELLCVIVTRHGIKIERKK